MHEVFLCRLAAHPVFRNDHNFRVFLEYDQDLAVRSKNKMEMFEVVFTIIYSSYKSFFFKLTFVSHIMSSILSEQYNSICIIITVLD